MIEQLFSERLSNMFPINSPYPNSIESQWKNIIPLYEIPYLGELSDGKRKNKIRWKNIRNLTLQFIVRTSNHVLYISNVFKLAKPDFFLRAQIKKMFGLASLDTLLTYNTWLEVRTMSLSPPMANLYLCINKCVFRCHESRGYMTWVVQWSTPKHPPNH